MVCTEKTPAVMTLYGDDYLSYNLSRKADSIVSNSDTTSLYFKTGQPDAHLFYAGNNNINNNNDSAVQYRLTA